ncbi:hypothetical protein LTS18_000507, partial [Coniosporium uncinatum]
MRNKALKDAHAESSRLKQAAERLTSRHSRKSTRRDQADSKVPTEKAHKVHGLGLETNAPAASTSHAQVEYPLSNDAPPAPSKTVEKPIRPKTPNTPLTPLEQTTPLPINYNYVISSLNSAPSISDQASQHTSSANTVTSRSIRSRSVVGGRSAVARKKTESLIADKSSFCSPPPSPTPERNPSTRIGKTKPTLDNAQEDQNDPFILDPVPQSRSKSQKKRWSHPDLPLRAEQKHNAKVAESEARRDRTDTILEEKPTSADSIDEAVDAFIHSPRLSQRIKHPRSG